jgi:hypothetical protein
MEYPYKFNKPMMKAPYKLMQLIGTENSGKERLTSKVRTLPVDCTFSELVPDASRVLIPILNVSGVLGHSKRALNFERYPNPMALSGAIPQSQ